MQTLTKVDFEISVQCTYLKNLGTRTEAGGEGHVPTSSTCNIPFNPRSTNLYNYISFSSLTLDIVVLVSFS